MALLAYFLTPQFRPAYRLTKVTDYAYSVDGALSIGIKNGKLVDQSSISQGVGAAHFTLKEKASNNTQTVDIGLEDKINASGNEDVGINFCYNSTKLGSLNGYTYKDYSILDSLRILEEFSDDPTNESNLLYSYVNSINKYIKVVTGAASLGSLLEVSKGISLAQIASFFGNAQFDNSFDSIEDNYLDNSTLYYPASDTIRIKINPNSNDSWVLVIDFSDETLSQGYSFGIGLENIKLSGFYGNFRINLFEADQNNDGNITSSEMNRLKINGFKTANPNSDPYVDLEDLPLLVKMGIKTCEAKDYHLTGNLNVPGIASLFGLANDFDINVHLTVLDEKGEDNVFMVDCYIEIIKSGSEISSSWLTSHEYYKVEFFLHKKDVYCKKTVITNGALNSRYATTLEYWKTSSDLFVSDLVYYMVVYILDISESTYNTIKGMVEGRDDKYLDYIQGLSNDKTNKKIHLDFKIVTGITGYFDIYYDTPNYNVPRIYLNFQVTSLLKINVDAYLNEIDDSHQTYIAKVTNFIDAFNYDSKTKNLGNRTSHIDSTNVYIYSSSNSTSYKLSDISHNGIDY